MAKKEIKCPHCRNWTIWTEALQDRCRNCDGVIEQKKVDRLNELAVRKRLEEEIKQARTANQNLLLRKAGSFAKAVSIGFMIVLTAIIVLAAG